MTRAHLLARDRHLRSILLLLPLLLAAWPGCGPAEPDSVAEARKPLLGPAAEGGDEASAAVWQAALEAWPQSGNLAILFGEPAIQAAMDTWMRGEYPPASLPPQCEPVMEKVRAFNDRLIALDGGWGPPPNPSVIRSMAVRGMRKTLWADVRLAVAERDAERLTDLLVVMANLPRVGHTYDATARGVLDTVGLADGFSWGLRDATTPEFDIQLTDEQCARIRAAASWIDMDDAFGSPGPEDERRIAVLGTYEAQTRTRTRDTLAKLCS